MEVEASARLVAHLMRQCLQLFGQRRRAAVEHSCAHQSSERERESGEHRWFRVVEKDLVVWAKRILTNCRIRMLRGDPREHFLPVGSGEMCPHLQNMVVSSELQMDK